MQGSKTSRRENPMKTIDATKQLRKMQKRAAKLAVVLLTQIKLHDSPGGLILLAEHKGSAKVGLYAQRTPTSHGLPRGAPSDVVRSSASVSDRRASVAPPSKPSPSASLPERPPFGGERRFAQTKAAFGSRSDGHDLRFSHPPWKRNVPCSTCVVQGAPRPTVQPSTMFPRSTRFTNSGHVRLVRVSVDHTVDNW
jgi:hypothetical protein